MTGLWPAVWIGTSRNNDRMYVRIQKDHGLQASYIDPISPLFNFFSDQPEYQGQYQWSHTFGSTMVNQFNAAGQWYAAAFNNDQSASLAAFPTTLIFGSGAYASLFGTALGGLNFDNSAGPQRNHISVCR